MKLASSVTSLSMLTCTVPVFPDGHRAPVQAATWDHIPAAAMRDLAARLAANGYEDWSTAVRNRLVSTRRAGGLEQPNTAQSIAGVLARSLVERPLFCDLLAHVPLNLERNVSLGAVRAFKIRAIAATADVSATLCDITPLRPDQAQNVTVTATVMAGALWQMAAPGTHLRTFYESDPELAHAVVDVEPRLIDILNALINGYALDATG